MRITVLPAQSTFHFECTIGWQLVQHFTSLLSENGVLFQLGSRWIGNLLKWINIGPKRKCTPKCHILWDTCKDTSPVGWNNQAAGISWQSWRRGKAEEGGLHSRIPVPHRWGLAYPCTMSPSCQVLALVLCRILLQLNNPVKGTNVLQKSHCCHACFLLTDIHLYG